jgi:hypothetical protein
MSRSIFFNKANENALKNIHFGIKLINKQTSIFKSIINDLNTIIEMTISIACETSFSVRQEYRKSISKLIHNIDNYIKLSNKDTDNDLLFTLAHNSYDNLNGAPVKFNKIGFVNYSLLDHLYYNKYHIGIANLGNNISKDSPNNYFFTYYPVKPYIECHSLGKINLARPGYGICEYVDDLTTVLFECQYQLKNKSIYHNDRFNSVKNDLRFHHYDEEIIYIKVNDYILVNNIPYRITNIVFKNNNFHNSNHSDQISNHSDHLENLSNHSNHLENLSNHSDYLENLSNHSDHLEHLSNHSDHLEHLSNHSDHLEHLSNHSDHLENLSNHSDHLENLSNHLDHLEHLSNHSDHLEHLSNHSDHLEHLSNHSDHLEHRSNHSDHLEHLSNHLDHLEHLSNHSDHLEHRSNHSNYLSNHPYHNNLKHSHNHTDNSEHSNYLSNHSDHNNLKHLIKEYNLNHNKYNFHDLRYSKYHKNKYNDLRCSEYHKHNFHDLRESQHKFHDIKESYHKHKFHDLRQKHDNHNEITKNINNIEYNCQRADRMIITINDYFTNHTKSIYKLITVIYCYIHDDNKQLIIHTSKPIHLLINEYILIRDIAYYVTKINSKCHHEDKYDSFFIKRTDNNDIPTAIHEDILSFPIYKILNTLKMALPDIYHNDNTVDTEIYGITSENHQKYVALMNGAINDLNILIEKNDILIETIKTEKQKLD